MKLSKNTVGFAAIIGLLLFTSATSLNLFFRHRAEDDSLDIRTFPYTIGNWKGKDLEITEREYDLLKTRNIIFREYTNAAQEKAYLFLIYSDTDRSVFHPPEACLIGEGATIVQKTTDTVGSKDKAFFANRLSIEKDNQNQIILYSYKVGKLYTENFYLQQLYFVLSQLFGKEGGGATIRVSTPFGNNKEASLDTLKSFMKETVIALEKLAQ